MRRLTQQLIRILLLAKRLGQKLGDDRVVDLLGQIFRGRIGGDLVVLHALGFPYESRSAETSSFCAFSLTTSWPSSIRAAIPLHVLPRQTELSLETLGKAFGLRLGLLEVGRDETRQLARSRRFRQLRQSPHQLLLDLQQLPQLNLKQRLQALR